MPPRSGNCSTRWRPAPRAPRSRSPSTARPTSRSPGSGAPRTCPTRASPARRRHSCRRAARACSWYASSRFSIRPIPPIASAPSSPKRELPRIGSPPLQGSEFSIETSIVPVALRLQFEGASDAGPDAFVIRSSTNEPLAAVTVSDADLQRARQRIRDRLLAAELALAGVLLLLLTGALLDWRRLDEIRGRGHGHHVLDRASCCSARARSSGSRFARPAWPSSRCCPRRRGRDSRASRSLPRSTSS